jgi:hypothetical protein
MKTTFEMDLTLCASEEAKICLTCKKKKCTPVDCTILKQKKKELKQRKKKNELDKLR